mmetsp:Transcript_19005/g.38370  ORF Transcript_19005/g.38370 Transcript_19005/m.38370 type:complete len:258 (+) Transcript_19005:1660-2433(+)
MLKSWGLFIWRWGSFVGPGIIKVKCRFTGEFPDGVRIFVHHLLRGDLVLFGHEYSRNFFPRDISVVVKCWFSWRWRNGRIRSLSVPVPGRMVFVCRYAPVVIKRRAVGGVLWAGYVVFRGLRRRASHPVYFRFVGFVGNIVVEYGGWPLFIGRGVFRVIHTGNWAVAVPIPGRVILRVDCGSVRAFDFASRSNLIVNWGRTVCSRDGPVSRPIPRGVFFGINCCSIWSLDFSCWSNGILHRIGALCTRSGAVAAPVP